MFSQILTFFIFFLLINDFFKTIVNSLSQIQEIDIFSQLINFPRDLWRYAIHFMKSKMAAKYFALCQN